MAQNLEMARRAESRGARDDSPRGGHVRPERAWILGPVGLACFAAVVWGWSRRDDLTIVPSEGLGYALGVVGLSMMVLLLLYSLRKRWSVLRRAAPIQHWFHIHMALGLLGPTAILFHSNFHFGSLNAAVALACMLTVSLSGVVGRFLYTRIHYEYLGRVATIDELRSEACAEGRVLAAAVRAVPEMGRVLADFRERCLGRSTGLLDRTWRFFTLGHQARVARRRALRAYRQAAARRAAAPPGAPSLREARRAVHENVRAVRRAGEYAAYERAFALWHALHLPFCVGLFLAAAVHVVAVNMY